MLQHRLHHLFALVVGQHELLGEIGQDAQAVGAGVDHEIDAAALALEIELAALVEDGRNDRERRRDRAVVQSGSLKDVPLEQDQ